MSVFTKSTQVSVSSPLLATDNEWLGQNNISGTFLSKGVVVPDISQVNTAISSALANISTGSFTCIQAYDTMQTPTFGTSLTLSYNTGMVYSFASTSAVTSLTINDIPTANSRVYVFSLLFVPNSANSPWYFTGTSITTNGVSTTLKGTVALPVAYTYIVQSITIIRTGTGTVVALNSVQGY